jgi:hypothetical protein
MRTIIVAGLLVISVSVIVVSSWGSAHVGQSPGLKIDGRTRAADIPDYVAYEFFFKSLINSPAEGVRGEKRVEAFGRQTGLGTEDSLLLLMDAPKVFEEIRTVDRGVKEIKDETWPNPPDHVWNQLREIQSQKEARIVQRVEELFSSYSPRMANQLRRFINTQVKSKIKGYADQPDAGQKQRPHRPKLGVVLATLLSPFLAGGLQMQGDETVYIYANATYSGTEYVFGVGDVSATAGSYGHGYSARTEIWGPCGQFDSGGTNVMSPLVYNGTLCDGQFSFYCFAVAACPISNTSFDNGQNQDTAIVTPFFVLGEFGAFSVATINVSAGAATIPITVSASQGMDTDRSVQLVFGFQQQTGSTTFTITGSQTVRLGPSANGTFTGSYDPTQSATNSTIKAAAMLNNPQPSAQQTGILPPPSKISTSVLTIAPQ